MTYDRDRAVAEMAPSKCYCHFGPPSVDEFFWDLSPLVTSTQCPQCYATDYQRYSQIKDMTGSPHAYNQVNHYRFESAKPRTVITKSYGNNDIFEFRWNGNFAAPISHLTSWYDPGVDWGDMVNQLSDKSSGALNESALTLATIGEARKTIQMIRNPYALLTKGWRKMVGDHSFKTLSKLSSNVWLESRYGWKAAYHDITNISSLLGYLYGASTIHKMEDSADRRWSVSRQYTASDGNWTIPFAASGDWVTTTGNKYPGGSWYPSTGAHIRYRKRGLKVATVSCLQRMEIAERWSRTRAVMRSLGIDARGALETIWELTPMSFVIDWFADPAGLLQVPASLARLHRQDIRNLGYSVKNEYQVDVEFVPKYAMYYSGGWGHGYDSSWVTESINCSIGTERASVYTRTPGVPPAGDIVSSFFGNGLSLINGLSGLSLIVQRALR